MKGLALEPIKYILKTAICVDEMLFGILKRKGEDCVGRNKFVIGCPGGGRNNGLEFLGRGQGFGWLKLSFKRTGGR